MHDFNQFGIAHFITHSDNVARTVAVILIIMSVLSWSVILLKVWRAWRIRRNADRILWRFWDDPAFCKEEACRIDHPYIRLGAMGIAAAEQYSACEIGTVCCSISDWLGAALRNAITFENARLETGLTVLASIGSTAPFVGLFGTVWGIYHALIAVGASGRLTLDAVAGPVGEALIMTAFGLAVAIPAVLGYNTLVRSNRVISVEFNTFAYELMTWLMSSSFIPQAKATIAEKVAVTKKVEYRHQDKDYQARAGGMV